MSFCIPTIFFFVSKPNFYGTSRDLKSAPTPPRKRKKKPPTEMKRKHTPIRPHQDQNTESRIQNLPLGKFKIKPTKNLAKTTTSAILQFLFGRN
ncbi:hypothetical protein BSKO_09298 [Bryopsis sp. KO-2023]|nr:hypothetical protein BSKO_09298 [Bryopsis sp. KO-2023]